jgi:hypothetical protein
MTSSWVSVMNCEVEGFSGSITWGWTPATPGTSPIARIAEDGSRPPAVKPVPMPIPRPATEIWPSTKRSPPSMKRTIRSAMAPSATIPATPMAMPAMVKAYPRSVRRRTATTPVGTRPAGRVGAAPRC